MPNMKGGVARELQIVIQYLYLKSIKRNMNVYDGESAFVKNNEAVTILHYAK